MSFDTENPTPLDPQKSSEPPLPNHGPTPSGGPTSPLPSLPGSLPRPAHRSRKSKWLIWAAVGFLAIYTGGFAIAGLSRGYARWAWWLSGGEPFTGPVWEVKKERLQLAIVERGTLESAENSDDHDEHQHDAHVHRLGHRRIALAETHRAGERRARRGDEQQCDERVSQAPHGYKFLVLR